MIVECQYKNNPKAINCAKLIQRFGGLREGSNYTCFECKERIKIAYYHSHKKLKKTGDNLLA